VGQQRPWREPDVVMAGCGDTPTREALAAVALLREHFPDLRMRFVNVVDLYTLTAGNRAPARTSVRPRFRQPLHHDKPIIFNFHGYPWLIHRLAYRRTNHDNLHVRGYKERGSINTPLELAIENEVDRFSLAIDVIDRVPSARARLPAQPDGLTLRHRHNDSHPGTMNLPGSARPALSPLHRALVVVMGCLLAFAVQATEGTGKRNSFGNVNDDAPRYRVFTYRQSNGVVAFTDQVPARQHSFSVMEFSCYACDPHSRVDWYATRLFTTEYTTQIAAAARRYDVDPALIRALIHAESGFNPNARSRKGAMGLMQLMPGTASDMGVSNAFVVQQNIEGGVKYLAMLLEQYRGDVTLATAAYNAGPGAVAKYGGVPPFAETVTYVQRVKLLHERYRTRA
jgi:hypothetical protein